MGRSTKPHDSANLLRRYHAKVVDIGYIVGYTIGYGWKGERHEEK